MSRLSQLLADYLALRRSLGFKLHQDGVRLAQFIEFLESENSSVITNDLALRWATQPHGISIGVAAGKLSVVRKFAAFAHAHDPRTQVPPRACLPCRIHRSSPYIYSLAEIEALVDAAQALRASSYTRSTLATLVALLAVTGMRIGEAIGLDRTDFDRREGVLTIRYAKFGKSRRVPLHPTTRLALIAYERQRDRTVRQPHSPAFFLSARGTRLLRQNVSVNFSRILRQAGMLERRPRRPRIHDLRHSFAVHTLCDWYRAGLDIDKHVLLLSTYLGHVGPSSTYWYLTAVPELVGLAAQRLELAVGDLP
jgi:integrase